jgi:hypothetical protein
VENGQENTSKVSIAIVQRVLVKNNIANMGVKTEQNTFIIVI